MHTVTIIRDRIAFGPYDEDRAVAYFRNGEILLNDLTRIDGRGAEIPFGEAAKQCGWRLPMPIKPWDVIRKIGLDFLFPLRLERLKELWNMRRERMIAIAGLVPLMALSLNCTLVIYVVLALYVSAMWGMFFWSQFKTESSSVKYGVISFCTTAFLSTTLLLILHSTRWLDLLDPLTESTSALLRFAGYFCCAGFPEEVCKAAIIFWLVRRPGLVLKPQDVVLYGLLSGFGFGIHEGLRYQLGLNRALNDVDATYVLNVLRLTSLPFLHACWCGISSYFIAYAAIAPMYRYGLWMLAILIPAIIHGAYDAMNGILGLAVALLGVALMFAYLNDAKTLRRKFL